MALAWGNDHIIIDTGRPKDPAASVYTTNTANLRGKPAITTEVGYLGMPDEEMVTRNYKSVLRLMRHLEMLPGPKEYVEHPLWIDRSEVQLGTSRGRVGGATSRDAAIGVGKAPWSPRRPLAQ